MEKHVSILASINTDITASASRLPRRGETVEGYSVDMFGGGKGANQSIQCARLGLDTRVIGMVGDDMQGAFVRESLIKSGVNIDSVEISKEYRTGCCSIYVDKNGDNTLVYAPGANRQITKELLEKSRGVIESASVFITQLEVNTDAVVYALKMAHDAGVTTILNPAPAIPFPEEAYQFVDYLTPNETECEGYTGILRSGMPAEEWQEKTYAWFHARGIRNLCITMGKEGSYFASEEGSLSVPAFSVKPVDTTAAGDAFHGGLVYGILNNLSMEKTLQIGNACGGLSTLTMGAQNSIQPLETVLSYLREHQIDVSTADSTVYGAERMQ